MLDGALGQALKMGKCANTKLALRDMIGASKRLLINNIICLTAAAPTFYTQHETIYSYKRLIDEIKRIIIQCGKKQILRRLQVWHV